MFHLTCHHPRQVFDFIPHPFSISPHPHSPEGCWCAQHLLDVPDVEVHVVLRADTLAGSPQTAPRPSRPLPTSSDHGATVLCREEGDGRRWPAPLRAASLVSCGCGDRPGGHGPAGPGQAWPEALHRPGMQPSTGPTHLWGLRGPGAVPGSHARAGDPWGQSGPEGPWGHPKLRVPGSHSEA